MIIQHNLTALNINGNYSVSAKNKAKISEKISSGYKINTAADDAAGLAVSRKLNKQVRGLRQAVSNIQDGVSMVQTADGAIAEIQDMLHRGRELSVMAANDVLTDEDREFLQDEIIQIRSEIDDISKNTEFNKIPLLRGNMPDITDQYGDVIIVGSMPDWTPMDPDVNNGANKILSGTYTTDVGYSYIDNSVTPPATKTGTTQIEHSAGRIDFTNFTGSKKDIEELAGNGFYATCCTCQSHYSIKFEDTATSSKKISGDNYIYTIGIKDATTPQDIISRIMAGTDGGNPNSHFTKLVEDPQSPGTLIVYDDRGKNQEPADLLNLRKDPASNFAYSMSDWDNQMFGVTAWGPYGRFGPGSAFSADDSEMFRDAESRILQVGSETGQELEVKLASTSSLALGIVKVNIGTQEGASQAIEVFKSALEYVNNERTRMGTYQNRLTAARRNLDNAVENTEKAESAIEDTDIAEASVKYAGTDMITKAEEMLLAQAKHTDDGVVKMFEQR